MIICYVVTIYVKYILTIICYSSGKLMYSNTAVIVGGIDMMTQSLQLAKKPHVIIGGCDQLVVCNTSYHHSNSWETGRSLRKH